MKKTGKSMLRSLLPYRLYYLLFEMMQDLSLLRLDLGRVDRNCRHLAAFAGQRATELNQFPGKGNTLNAHELSIFSQNGEDGILMYIFARVGTTNKTFVEFGVEDGRECNAANLAISHGWRGLFMDGSAENVAKGRAYYGTVLEDDARRVTFTRAFVTAENINQLILEQGVEGEIDLLSIDIDGNDYWVWKAIDCINPRVVVIEYNASLGPRRRVTIPYESDFVWNSKSFPEILFTGASLSLLTRLAETKGYILTGCDSGGVNAFFVRKDVAKGKIQSVPVEMAFFPHARRNARFPGQDQEKAIDAFHFVDPETQ